MSDIREKHCLDDKSQIHTCIYVHQKSSKFETSYDPKSRDNSN